MTATTDQLGSLLSDLATAVGVLAADGSLNADWFDKPLDSLSRVLSDPGQHNALLAALGVLAPSDGVALPASVGAQVTAFPLVSGTSVGNVYATVETAADGSTVFGVGGSVRGPEAAPVATVSAYVPLVAAGDQLRLVVATAEHPITLDARLVLDWTPPADPFAVEAIALRATFPLADGDPGFLIILENLDLGGGPVARTTLDPAALGPESAKLIGALLGQALHAAQAAAGAGTAELVALAENLPALLGITGDLPAFPFAELHTDPGAARAWLAAALANAATATSWVNHLAGLLGSGITGSGTATDPWQIALLAAAAGVPGVALTLATQLDPTGSGRQQLLVGVCVSAGIATATLAATATLLTVDLTGTSGVRVGGAARVDLTVAGSGGPLLAVPAAGVSGVGIETVRAGVIWDGTHVAGLLELDGVDVDLPAVTTQRTHFDRLDLTNAGTVGAAATAVLIDAVKGMLGVTPGTANDARVEAALALVGLSDAAGAPGVNIDLATLASAPTRALSEYYRQLLALADGTGGAWLHRQLAALIGLASATTDGTGTVADPWRAIWDATGDVQMEVVAYDAAAAADQTRQWRVGLRASWSHSYWSAAWMLDLISVDLPAGAPADVRLLSGHHVTLSATGLPALPAVGGVTFSLGGAAAALDWQPGEPLLVDLALDAITATDQIESVTLDRLVLGPPDAGGALGLNADPGELWALGRLLAAAQLGQTPWGALLVQLAGLSTAGGGLPSFPLVDRTDVLSSLTHPDTALRQHVRGLITGVAADGSLLADTALPMLAALLAGATGDVPAVTGGGTRDDPWTVAATDAAGGTAQGLAWLEPDGPPAGARAARLTALTGAADWPAALTAADALRGYAPHLADALYAVNTSPAGMPAALDSLAAALAAGDGVVASANATAASWSTGTAVPCAHHLLPEHPDAVRQVRDQLTNWHAWNATDSVVLLVGPSFTDAHSWDALVAGQSSATVSLRQPGVDPLAVDLSGLPSSARCYAVELVDDGSGDVAGQVAQLRRVALAIAAAQPEAAHYVVAHSSAGVIACQYVVDHAHGPSPVAGLITLGAPLAPSAVASISDHSCADACRLLDRLLPGTFPAKPLADPVADALTHVLAVLDGWAPAASAGAAPTPAPYPLATFAATAPAVTAALATTPLSIPGRLLARADAGAVRTWVLTQLHDLIAAGADHAAPTHLGLGVRAGLVESDAGQMRTEIAARLDVARVAVTVPPVAAPEELFRSWRVEVRAAVPGGWLVGGPGDGTTLDARMRWARLALGRDDAAGPALTLDGTFHDTALNGTAAPSIPLTDPAAPALLAQVWTSLAPLWFVDTDDSDDDADSDGSPGDPTAVEVIPDWGSHPLAGLFVALGLTVGGDAADVTLSADAWAQLLADPAGFLAANAAAALAGGGLGFVTGADGAPTCPVPGLPIDIVLATNPFLAHIRTRAGGWQTGPATITVDLTATPPAAAGAATGLAGQLGIAIGPLALSAKLGPGGPSMSVALPPWLPQLTVVPLPTPEALRTELVAVALPALTAAGASLGVRAALPNPPLQLGGLAQVIRNPGARLATLFAAPYGTGWDVGRLAGMLAALGTAVGLPVDANGAITLPGANVLAVDADGTAAKVSLRPSLAGVLPGLTVDLALRIDEAFHIEPSGSLTVLVPLPVAAALGGVGLTGLSVRVGVDGTAVSVSVTPDAAPGAANPPAPITLLPSFGGFAALAGDAAALLPAVLDAAVTALHAAGASTMLTSALDVAAALDLYPQLTAGAAPPADGFATHGAQLVALATSGLRDLAAAAQTAVATAVAQLFELPEMRAAIPGRVRGAAGILTWTVQPAGGPAIGVSAGWTGTALDLGVSVGAVSAGPVTASIDVAVDVPVDGSGAALTADLAASVHFDTTDVLGFALAPALHISAAEQPGQAVAVAVRIAPLSADPGLVVTVAPKPGVAGDVRELVAAWAEPAAAQLALRALQSAALLARTPWAGAPTVQALLTSAGLVKTTATGLVATLPDPTNMLHDLIGALAAAPAIPVSPTVSLAAATTVDNGVTRFGIAIRDTAGIPLGDDVQVVLHLSPPTGWPSAAADVTTLYLGTVSAAGALAVAPRLDLTLGAGVAHRSGAPLLVTNVVRLGAVAGYLRGTLDVDGGVQLTDVAGRVELHDFGLPLTASKDASNPMASQLLAADGSGDAATAAPTTDLALYTLPGSTDVHLDLGSAADPTAEVVWLPVHRTIGPLYLDQVGVGYAQTDMRLSLLVDGNVSISALTASVEGLGVGIPLRSAGRLADWTVDLAGIAVALDTADVHIAGGLVKTTTADHSVEYDGMVRIEVAGRGISAVGAYAAEHGYTSLFVFAATDFPLGGPPFFFVEALAGGIGINRGLLVPSDPLQIPHSPLVVAAESASAGSGGDLGDMLASIKTSLPAQRGSYWLAAGIRFSTFALLDTVAVAYVQLAGNAVDVGLIGVSSLIQPPVHPLISVQLALAARFSTSDDVLSVRAQLTDNSWLLSKDCQLTGGFALIVDFRRPWFVFTVGGFATDFVSDVALPAVPRVGFHWAVSDTVVVKGQAYFALLSNCVMWGGEVDVTFAAGPVKAWFSAWMTALIAWEPFNLEVTAGVQLGASLDLSVTLFGVTVSVKLSFQIGVTVVLKGMPIYARVTVQLGPLSATIPIGTQPNKKLELPSWTDFYAKYQLGPVTHVSAGTGAATPDDAATGGPAATTTTPDGSAGAPFLVQPAFTLQLGTTVPVAHFSVTLPGGAATAYPVNQTPVLTPQAAQVGTTDFSVAVTVTGPAGAAVAGGATVNAGVGGFAQATWEGRAGKASADLLPGGNGLTLAFTGRLGPAAGADISVSTGFVQVATTGVGLGAATTVAAPAAARAAAGSATAARVARVARLQPGFVAAGQDGRRSRVARRVNFAVERAAARSGEATQAMLPGATHVWDLEPATGERHEITGAGVGGMRMTFLTRSGLVLRDVEGRADQLAVTVPRGCARVAVTALGGTRLPHEWGSTGFLTADRAPDDDRAITGWSVGADLVQVSPRTALARGAVLDWGVPLGAGASYRHGCAIRAPRDLLERIGELVTLMRGGEATLALGLAPRVDPDDVELTVDGRAVRRTRRGRARTGDSGTWRLARLATPAEAVDVRVRCQPGAITAVLRLPGQPDHWADTPVPDPPRSPLPGAPVRVRIRIRIRSVGEQRP